MERIKYDEQAYIYGSTRIRAVETRMTGSERISRAAEARSLAEAVRVLEEGGIRLSGGAYEAALSEILADTYAVMSEVAPDRALFDILRYPYDCHNMKAAIKCDIRGTDCAGLLYSVGTIAEADVMRMAREHDFSAAPEHMGRAAAAAYEGYAKTLDPQQIDILIDRACYLDMEARAGQYALPFFTRLVQMKADTTNILTCVRLLRMRSALYGYGYFERVMLPAGTLEASFFSEAFVEADGETALYERISTSAYHGLRLTAAMTLTAVERLCEEYYLRSVRESAREKLYGAEVIAAYVAARETEIKNIRIVIAGRAASLPAETIRERLRRA